MNDVKETQLSKNPSRHLSAAGENVRAFCHDSFDSRLGWQYPPNAYDAIGSLSHMVGMLEQAIDQTTFPVTRTHKDGRVLIDGGRDADAAVAVLLEATNDAKRAAAALTSAVQRMHNAISPMGLDTRGLPEFDDDEPHGWE